MLRLIALLILLGSEAQAFEVSKPLGAPEVYLPDYSVTVSVFATTSPVGSGLAIGIKQPSGKFDVCGTCSYFATNLESEVAFKGGEVAYIEAVRGEINAIFARKFPPLSGPVGNSTVERLNSALGNYNLTSGGLFPK